MRTMPWWAWLWAVVLLGSSIGGARIDFKKGELAMGLLGLFSGAASILGMVGHFRAEWITPLLPILAPLCAAGAVWLVIETAADTRTEWHEVDPDMSQRAHRVFVLLALAAVPMLYGPALALGIRAGVLR